MTIKTFCTVPQLHRLVILSALCTGVGSLTIASAQTVASSTTAPQTDLKPGALDRTQAASLLPKTVFYKGLTATIQGRNSAGIRFADGNLVLMTLVDTSGYSSAVAQTYQAYLLNEVHLKIGDKVLPPGAYGFGFVGGDRMVVMDIAGNELLRATTTRDPQLARPDPLHIVAEEGTPGHYRLYLGRSYVTLSAEK